MIGKILGGATLSTLQGAILLPLAATVGATFEPAGFRRSFRFPLSFFLWDQRHGFLAGLENRILARVPHHHEHGAPSPLDGLRGGLRVQRLALAEVFHESKSLYLRGGGSPAGSFSNPRFGADTVLRDLPRNFKFSRSDFLWTFLMGSGEHKGETLMVQPDSLKKWFAGSLALGALAFLGWRVVGSRPSESS